MEALLDTGNLAGDSQLTVCSGLDNTCHTLNTKVDLGITFHNELLNNNDTFDISPVILKETQIGRAHV